MYSSEYREDATATAAATSTANELEKDSEDANGGVIWSSSWSTRFDGGRCFVRGVTWRRFEYWRVYSKA